LRIYKRLEANKSAILKAVLTVRVLPQLRAINNITHSEYAAFPALLEEINAIADLSRSVR